LAIYLSLIVRDQLHSRLDHQKTDQMDTTTAPGSRIQAQEKAFGHAGAASQPLEETLNDDSYRLVRSHRNARNQWTLEFDNGNGVKQIYANVDPFKHPKVHDMLGLVTPEQPLETTLKDTKWQIVDQHTNARGSYTLVFENDQGGRMIYANVDLDRHEGLRQRMNI
jgi:hypothetical protein